LAVGDPGPSWPAIRRRCDPWPRAESRPDPAGDADRQPARGWPRCLDVRWAEFDSPSCTGPGRVGGVPIDGQDHPPGHPAGRLDPASWLDQRE
jgi:hypothetical protein